MYRIITEEELKRKLTTSLESYKNHNPINQYFIPKIKCPWTVKINSNFDANDSNQTLDYIIKNCNVVDDKVREQIKLVRGGESALWVYPFAEKQKIKNLVNFMNFLFIIDDHEECKWGDAYDETKSIKFWTNFSSLFDNKHIVDMTSMPKYFLECKISFDKIYDDLSEKQKHIFVETFVNWILTCKYKETSNTNLKVLDLESQLENRVYNSAMIYFSFLIEYGMNIDLNDYTRSHPLMSEYVHEMISNVCYVNDLYSFRKEYIDANGHLNRMSNTMATLVNYHKLDINTAVLLMKAKIEQCFENCKRIKSEIQTEPELFGLSVEKYIKGSEQLMAGNLMYNKTSPRFHGKYVDVSNSMITLSLNENIIENENY